MLFSIFAMSFLFFVQIISAAPSSNSGEPKEYVTEGSFPSSFENVGGSRSRGGANPNKKKITRQIFDVEGDDGDGNVNNYREQQRPRSKERFSSTEESSKPVEEFNGFPADFTKGLKPFDFEDSSASHRHSKSSGFVDFTVNDHQLPSLASSLGGLTPFPPLKASKGSSVSLDDGQSSSDVGSTEKSRPGDNDHITPNSFLSRGQRPLYIREGDVDGGDADTGGFTSRPLKETTASFENKDAAERHPSGAGRDYKEEFIGQNPEELDDRSTENDRPASDVDQFDDSNDERNAFEGGSEKPSSERLPLSSEDFDQDQPPSSTSSLSSSFSRPSKNTFKNKNRFASAPSTGDFQDEQFSFGPSSSSSSSSAFKTPTENFRDLNEFHQSESQNFVPVAQFHNRPLAFPMLGRFRPLEAAAPNPTVRNFRQVSQQPHFFLTQGQFPHDNGFFGGGGDFGHAFTQIPASNFESSHKFSQPEFRFHPDQQHQQQRHRQPHHVAPHQQLHSDDMTNHHSSATNNILGSGNFGIIRGGIFADADNPPEQPFRSFHGLQHGSHGHGDEDFFHGFRDFQPFGGTLNNALSRKSHNIHRSPSRTAEVTVRPSSRSSNTTSTEDSTILDTATGQLMQEK